VHRPTAAVMFIYCSRLRSYWLQLIVTDALSGISWNPIDSTQPVVCSCCQVTSMKPHKLDVVTLETRGVHLPDAFFWCM
jgi:hypothetical protein